VVNLLSCCIYKSNLWSILVIVFEDQSMIGLSMVMHSTFPVPLFCLTSYLYMARLLSYQVGVDNMCILVHAVKRQPLELPLEGRISNALVEVGPSITLASLSEVLAFAVGSFIPMPACRVFSMFAG
jgi:hypothetical protein